MLLTTKLLQPQTSPFAIPRPRLLTKLDQSLGGKLTVVVAPAGYGKTTLVSNWADRLNATETRVAWCMLDQYDNEPVRFLQYFIGALQRYDETVGRHCQEMLQTAQINSMHLAPETVITVLINDLAQTTTPGVLILDDLHVIDDPQIIDAVRFWIEHAPAHIHTVITSRDASMLPLARWRTRAQLTEITSQELRCTEDEAIAFIRGMVGATLTDADIRRLTARTQGWMAGLQLAALSLDGSETPQQLIDDFTGSDRHVMDFLIEEVLAEQPDELRRFLLQTSILQQLTPEICNAVTQRDDSHTLLAQLERRNLFLLALDNRRHAYRYHPLFAESLHAQLQLGSMNEYRALHTRAYRWAENAGDLEAAVEHALAAGSYDDAAEIIDRLTQSVIWEQSRPQQFLRWCAALPDDTISGHPALAISLAWTYILTQQFAELERHMTRLRDSWSDAQMTPALGSELAVLEAEVAVHEGDITAVLRILNGIEPEQRLKNSATQAILEQIHGFALRLDGNVEQAVMRLEQAMIIATEAQQISIWVYAGSDLAETYMMAGRLRDAERVYQTIFGRYPQEQYPKIQYLSFARIGYGKLLAMRNQHGAAAEQILRGIGLGMVAEQDTAITQAGYLVLARIRQAQGNWSAARKFLAQAEAFSRSSQSQRTRARVAELSARLHLLQGETDEAARLLDPFTVQTTSELPRYQQQQMQMTQARNTLANDPAAALPRLESLCEVAADNQWGESLLEGYVMLALAHHALGREKAAQAALQQALALAAPEAHILPFVIEGAPMAQLLRDATRQRGPDDFIGKLQASYLPTIDEAQPLIEPLTKRELEVLGMMAKGLSNPEIAEQMILATGTIAKYSNNIYGKLGVRNRTEAAQQAKALGLI